MTYWLVLLLTGGAAPLHVGNYKSLSDCEAAAKQAIEYNPAAPRIAGTPYNFFCIQVNENGNQSAKLGHPRIARDVVGGEHNASIERRWKTRCLPPGSGRENRRS